MTILISAFILPWIYWVYLLSSTSMVIVYDGATFQGLATTIDQGGWQAYFKTGPHNEPIYPFLVATAMQWARHFHFPYEKILTVMQLLILALSQVLVFTLLKKLKINKFLIAGIVLYMGISPALVNAALSHWSEITAVPFVLGFILLSSTAFEQLENGTLKTMALTALNLSLMCVGLVCVKALFEYILPICFLPFIFSLLKSIGARKQKTIKNASIFLLTALSVFYSFIYGYKSLNQHFNGHFVMADRGPYIIYGNVVKRTNPISSHSFMASMAFIPGDGVCKKIFSTEECDYWTLQTVDGFGQGKLRQLQQEGMPEALVDQTLLAMAKNKIFEHPLRYGVLTLFEGFKIFFWESTHVGFVRYPLWLTNIFNVTVFKNGLRLIVAFLSVFAFCFCLRYLCINRQPLAPIVFIVYLILPFAAFYSLFYIHTRYCFPIAPLYLILIAFWIQGLISKKSTV